MTFSPIGINGKDRSGILLVMKTTGSKPGFSAEFDKFKGFMQRLVAVPHSEIKAAMEAEKKAKASASHGPASSSKRP